MKRHTKERLTLIAAALIVVAISLSAVIIGWWLGKDDQDAVRPPGTTIPIGLPEPHMTPGFVSRQPRASRGRIVATTRSATAMPPRPIVHKTVGFSALELRISTCESHGNYRDENPTSTASGRWQVIDGTWDDFHGYHHASSAPPWVQDLWARTYFDKNGYSAWNASRSCWS